ncbi:hypothetical protein C0J52_19802 [Blattella germanica]|nr:hypothetical protein C0J52_19802 [Blattella germanica]
MKSDEALRDALQRLDIAVHCKKINQAIEYNIGGALQHATIHYPDLAMENWELKYILYILHMEEEDVGVALFSSHRLPVLARYNSGSGGQLMGHEMRSLVFPLITTVTHFVLCNKFRASDSGHAKEPPDDQDFVFKGACAPQVVDRMDSANPRAKFARAVNRSTWAARRGPAPYKQERACQLDR